jgi:hypothetical protein
MTKRIAHLIEEHENKLELLRTIDSDVEAEITQIDLKKLFHTKE